MFYLLLNYKITDLVNLIKINKMITEILNIEPKPLVKENIKENYYNPD